MAAGLNRAGLGTLLVDLLTAAEELSRACVFNVALLAVRLKAITRWLGSQPATAAVPVAYFGASTGTAAALAAVTDTPRLPVTAIVSRGGRPDLVGGRLGLVQAPTLLIAGGADKLAVIPGATRLLEEPGALGQVTDLAGDWFARHSARMSNIAVVA